MKKITTTTVKEYDVDGKLLKHTETKVTEETVQDNLTDCFNKPFSKIYGYYNPSVTL